MMAMDLEGCEAGYLRQDTTTSRRRIKILEERVGELESNVCYLADTIGTCLECLESIEKVDRDTMRMVSMLIGYSDGE